MLRVPEYGTRPGVRRLFVPFIIRGTVGGLWENSYFFLKVVYSEYFPIEYVTKFGNIVNRPHLCTINRSVSNEV